MIVEQLLLIPSASYNDMFVRPYTLRTNEHQVMQLQEQTEGGRRLQAGNLAGLAGQILQPASQAGGVVQIAHGWGHQRMRFLMRVRHESPAGNRYQYVTGYTDHVGANMNTGSVDPNMRFHVNNTITMRSVMVPTASGRVVEQRVQEASQVLVGNVVQDFRQMQHSMHSMRPEDVFATIGASFEDKSPIDVRTGWHSSPMKLSRRANGSASHYLSSMLGTYRNTLQSEDSHIRDWSSIADKMSGVVKEATVTADPFLGELIRMGTSLTEGSTFTYGELCRIAQGVEMHTDLLRQSPVEQAQMHQVGQTADWGEQRFEPQIATIVMHSLPTVMVELMLTQIGFHLTNRNIGGQPTMDVYSALSFANGADVRPYVNSLQQRVITEIFRDITRNGEIDVSIQGTINLVGETRLLIQYGGNPPREYAAPSFADALMAPVVAYDLNNVQSIGMEIDTLANQLAMDLSPSAYAYGNQGGSPAAPAGGGIVGPAI